MQLTERIHLVASGGAGVSLTNAYDCNVYLVACAHGYLLVDSGVGLEPQRIKKQLNAAGYRPQDCQAILLTHAHADHSAGAAWLTEYTSAPSYALRESARYITGGDTKAIALDAAIHAGIYPQGFVYNACPVNSLNDGESLIVGGLGVKVVATPGHCSGHAAYLMELDGVKTLFSGDCIYPGGVISLQAIWDCSIQQYMETIDRLAALDYEALIPSHFGFMLANGKAPVLMAQKKFRKLAMPPNPGEG